MERSDSRMDYPRALSEHLIERQYRPETVAFIGHACRRGCYSQQGVLELLETVEADRRTTDLGMVTIPIVTGTQGSLEWE